MKRPPTSVRSNRNISMTSMIDVVFLLLVFFVWTSSFDAPEKDLPGNIAIATEASVSTSESPDQVTQSIESPVSELLLRIQTTSSSNIQYLLGTTSLATLSDLQNRLVAIAELDLAPTIIVDPDDSVSMAQTIEVLDLLRTNGFTDSFLAVEPSAPTPSM
ncbi:biopolymer transporter ExbD [Rhodopirellula halodulae]|nr:biopolymer transporter ExbD [Rhodopirellula sp. JC740]